MKVKKLGKKYKLLDDDFFVILAKNSEGLVFAVI
jgi:hypothetical protein